MSQIKVDTITNGAGTGAPNFPNSISVAGTAISFPATRTDWNNTTAINGVVGQLAWKNYGNNHTIFDASNSTSPSGTAVNNTNSQISWAGSYPTLMGWNGVNTYGVRVDSARVADNAMGVGQEWQAVSRASGTVYQNTTGRPIQVGINQYGQNGQLYIGLTSNPTQSIYWNNSSGAGYYEQNHCNSIIPNGYYYKMTGAINGWNELR